jgi:hypothetical protein
MRTVLLAAVAVFAFSAVAAAAAQADQYFVNGSALTSSESFSVTASGTFVLHAKPLGTNTTITCSSVTASGSLEAAGASSSSLKFSSCVVSEVKNCTVAEPINTSVNDKLIGGEGAIEDEFVPPGGETGTFTEITLNNGAKACSVKGTYKVTGTQKCSLSSAETEAVEHELSCAVSGSNLTLGGRAATFESTGVPIKLTSGNHYSAQAH